MSLSCSCQEVSKAAPPPSQGGGGTFAPGPMGPAPGAHTSWGNVWAPAPQLWGVLVLSPSSGGRAESPRGYAEAGSVAGPAGGRGRSSFPCSRPLPPQPPSLALSGARAGAGVPGGRQRLGEVRRAARTG